MRISEFYGARVIDELSHEVGCVHDVRIASVRDRSTRTFEVTGLVVGPSGALSRAAHAWGYAEGRTQAPWLLRSLLAGAVRASRFVPAERIADWGPGALTITGSGEQLEALTERLRHE